MGVTLRYLACLAPGCAVLLMGAPAGAQGTWHYRSGQPDLVFVRDSVRLVRDGQPVQNVDRPGPVVVEAEIQNGGPGVAYDVVVRVADNGREVAERKIATLVTGGTYRLSAKWTAKRGPHRLTIALDPDGRIAEVNEKNNLAVITAPVPRSPWPILALIVALLGAGAVAVYASWRLSTRPRPAPAPPPEKPQDQAPPA